MSKIVIVILIYHRYKPTDLILGFVYHLEFSLIYIFGNWHCFHHLVGRREVPTPLGPLQKASHNH
jgi:hypothetical protein